MNIIYLRVISSIIALILLAGCSNSFIQGQGFFLSELPLQNSYNSPIQTNINLKLVDVNNVPIQVLDSMPKISSAKIPADLRNISFSSKIDNTYPTYLIGPGDEIKIEFPTDGNVNNITAKGLKVDAYGEIEFPYLGSYKISGFNAREAEDLLKIALSELYVDPEVYLTIKKFNSNKIFVSGVMANSTSDTVSTPSIETTVVNLDDVPMTVIQALNSAGVKFSEASPNPFLILKRGDSNHIVDLGFITNNADPNIYVKNNDFLYLPNTQSQKVYLTGAVNSDMLIDFPSTMTLSEALIRSNIDKVNANLEEIYVLRVNQTINNSFHGSAYKLNFKSPTSLVTASNFYLLDRDIIFVSSRKLARWNQTMTTLLNSLDFINLWKSYKPINSEVFRTQ